MNTLRLEYLDPATLQDNPQNWRNHPSSQTSALKDLLKEVGWAGALLLNERTGHLVDGHARKAVSTGEKVPVLIGNWTEDQEKLILATLDPLVGMAGTDQGTLDQLLSEISTNSESVQQLLESLSSVSFDEGQEFDESCADDVKMCKCPNCGTEFPL